MGFIWFAININYTLITIFTTIRSQTHIKYHVRPSSLKAAFHRAEYNQHKLPKYARRKRHLTFLRLSVSLSQNDQQQPSQANSGVKAKDTTYESQQGLINSVMRCDTHVEPICCAEITRQEGNSLLQKFSGKGRRNTIRRRILRQCWLLLSPPYCSAADGWSLKDPGISRIPPIWQKMCGPDCR